MYQNQLSLFPACLSDDSELEQRQQIQQKIIIFSPSSFGCSDCPFVSSYKNSMMNHIEARHIEGVYYPCRSCHKVCNSRVALAMHTRRVHMKLGN
jgi:hypothetical protein